MLRVERLAAKPAVENRGQGRTCTVQALSGEDRLNTSRLCAGRLRALAAAPLLALLAGCAAVPAANEMLGTALESVGLKKKADDGLLLGGNGAPPVPVALRLHASPSLNLDPQGRALGLWLRVYKLRQIDGFLGAPYEVFGDKEREREAFGDHLAAARDLQLVPGQQLRVDEQLPRDVPYVAVVALFHSPAPQRWRYVFKVSDLPKQGLILGAHSCALSVQQGEAIGLHASIARSAPAICS